MNSLRISLFGDMRIAHDNGSVMANVTRTTQALLAYLLLQPHRPQPRDVLADVFWGDRSQERARNCLNTALWRLRRILEPAGTPDGTYLLTTPAGDISFNWQSEHWLDVAVFESEVRQILVKPIAGLKPEDVHHFEEALQLYTGDLLEGFYDDWAIRERERLRQLYVSGLNHLMRLYQQQGEFDKALASGLKLLDLDPLREEIHRSVMRLYCDGGQRTLAVRQYAVCRDLLQQELGIQPMAETQSLYAQLVQNADEPAAPESLDRELLHIRHALQQLSLTLRSLDKIRDQLQHALQLIERNSQDYRHPPRP
jgi:DNA-binding SARP family transcriptional activator